MKQSGKQLTKQVLASLLAASTLGVMGMAGTAFAADPITWSNHTLNNWYGGYVSGVRNITFGDVKDNALVPDAAMDAYSGGAALGGGLNFEGYVATDVLIPEPTAVNATFQNSTISGNTATSGLEVYGGAMEVKGTNATFNDVVIENNSAISNTAYGNVIGGAIATSRKGNIYYVYRQNEDGSYVLDDNGDKIIDQKSIKLPTHLTFNVTKDAAFTGNTIVKEGGDTSKLYVYNGYGTVGPSGGGFLAMEPGTDTTFNISDGATLTIGAAGAVTGDTDTISTLIPTTTAAEAYNPFIVKQGEGTLTINSNLDKYYGDFTVEGGTVNLNANLNLASTYKVTGGTLNLADVTIDKLYDKLAATGITGYAANAANQTLTAANLYNQEGSAFAKTDQPTSVTVKVTNTAGSLTTAAGTTTNANSITVTDGGSINAEGALNVTGDLSADASTVTAKNATIGGTVSSTNGSTVTLGGDNLNLSTVKVDDSSTLTLTSGKLTTADLKTAITGTGKLTLDGTATLSTVADQVFTNANTTESETSKDNALTEAAAKVNFKAGTLSLSDAKYTITYLKDIKNVMTTAQANTQVIMEGTLVGTDEQTSNTVSLADAEDVGSNIALDKVTVETNSNAETGAVNISNGVNVGALAVDENTTTVAVAKNTEVTLGGTTTTEVIQSAANTTPEVSLAEGSTLNIGNAQAAVDNTTLNVKADLVATTATSNINTNGTTTVDGSVSLAGSTLAAKTGTLTVNKDLTAATGSTLTGNVTVAGTVKTDSNDATINIGGTEEGTAANVTVSNVALNEASTLAVQKNSTLTLQSTSADQPATVTAKVTADNSTIVSNGPAEVNGTIALTNAAIQSKDGSLAIKELTTSGTNTLTGDVAVAGTIKAADDQVSTLNIGTEGTAANVTVSNVDLNTGSSLAVQKDSTLTLQSTTTAPATVKADVAATGSTIASQGDAQINGTVTLTDAAIQSTAGSLAVDTLSTAGTSTITGDVAVTGDITGTANTTLNLGTGTTAATLTADKVSLNGGTLYLDPVWNGGTQDDGTEVAIESLDGANVVVGENSTLTLGSKDTTAAENMFKETGLSWGSDGILSALYLASSQDLTTNSIVVSSEATSDSAAEAGTFSMGTASLLMVNGSTVSGSNTAAITGVTSTSVSDSAKLYISGATAGTTYNILSGTSVKSGNAWYADANADTTSNVFTHNQLLKFVGAEGNGDTQYSVTAEAKDATDVYGNALNAANVVSAAVAAGGAAGTLFGNAANSDVHSTTASQVNALNSATSLTELAGVQHGLYTAGNLFTGAVANHLADVKDTTLDKDLWAHYIHDKENIRGLAVDGLSGADYDAQYNGVVVGSDLYHKNGVVAGAALTYMDGSFSGNTDTASTKNDADYYGLSLYGRVRRGQTSYLGDISWLHGKNDLSQYNSGSEITGDVSSNAYTAGVRAEHDFAAGDGTLTPYAGVRYAHLDYGNYTDSLGIHHDSDNANLWLIPVGLRYTQDFSMDGWNVKPIAEAGYLWTLGDRNSDERLNLNGSSSTFGYDVSDSGSFYGRLGIEAEHGPMTYGLGYQYQKGSDVRSNVWSLALRYKF